MNFNLLIENLDNYFRQGNFLSLVLLAIISSLLYDVFKKVFFHIAVLSLNFTKSAGNGISNWNKRNIEYLIMNFKNDIIKVEKVKNKNLDFFFELLHNLYFNLSIFFIMLILYFIVVKIDNPILFCSVICFNLRYLISIIASVHYNTTLFDNAKNFDKYKLKKEKRIIMLEKLLVK